MKLEIEKELTKILGLPFQYAGRAGNMVWIGFGDLKSVKNKLGERIVAEYSIHIQCSWRIASSKEILIACRDLYVPCSSSYWERYDEDFDWDVAGQNRFDELIKNFNEENESHTFVKAISADNYGGVKIFLSNDTHLEIFPDESTEEECWRMFSVGDLDSHLVITGSGIEDED